MSYVTFWPQLSYLVNVLSAISTEKQLDYHGNRTDFRQLEQGYQSVASISTQLRPRYCQSADRIIPRFLSLLSPAVKQQNPVRSAPGGVFLLAGCRVVHYPESRHP